MGGVAAAATIAVSAGAIKLPGSSDGPGSTPTTDQATLAAQRTAADKHWASATCTNILDWKNEITRDGTSLDLGLGPSARVNDAITATTRLAGQLDQVGLPPGARTAQAQAELNRLRSDIATRVRALKGAATSLAGGNLAAIGTLATELGRDRGLGTQITAELRHVVSVDLGLSLAETRACRQLAGIPI